MSYNLDVPTWQREADATLTAITELYSFHTAPRSQILPIVEVPDVPFPAYRGATPATARGIWWSTELHVAERYARSRSLEGNVAHVYGACIDPAAIIHAHPGDEVLAHPEHLGSVCTFVARGRRLPGREAEQTLRWAQHRAWEIANMRRGGGGYYTRQQLRGIPTDPVQIYRGATPETWNGVHWSTDEADAQTNAELAIQEGWEGRVYSTTVAPAAIFAFGPFGTGRWDSDLCDVWPAALADLDITNRPA